jgi:hypothetical protein
VEFREKGIVVFYHDGRKLGQHLRKDRSSGPGERDCFTM